MFQACVATSKQISNTQNGLLEEVKAEGEKFGEDVKYLADFTGGQKKFEPWIQAAEAKKSKGMSKPANLTEAINMLNSANVSVPFKFCQICLWLRNYCKICV